jgi:hypothetical protein
MGNNNSEPNFGSSGDDLRAFIAYHKVPVYRIAYRLGFHPATLSKYLHNHAPISDALAAAIKQAVLDERTAGAGR